MIFEHFELLQKAVSDELVSVQRHPMGQLYIYNYTPKCQFSKSWNDTTKAARGLILDGSGNIIARPFPKFFNLEEHSRSDIVFSKSFEVTEKVDGSLGIMYPQPDGSIGIATRGSFISSQANWATSWIHNKQSEWCSQIEKLGIHYSLTWLFEIIYPENRIVVDYGDTESLIFLTVIDIATGRDVVQDAYVWPERSVKTFPVDCKPRDVVANLNPKDDGNTEGFVLRFNWPKDGPYTRVKIKLDEYLRLHRLFYGVSSKSIWEYLRTGQDINDIIDKTPDEFSHWVQSTVDELQAAFMDIKMQTIADFNDITSANQEASRREFAQIAKTKKYPHLLFKLLDDKIDGFEGEIWKIVKPEYSRPYLNWGE